MYYHCTHVFYMVNHNLNNKATSNTDNDNKHADANGDASDNDNGSVRPISLLTLWISEGLTRA